MKQVRVNVTYYADGTMTAMLQELEGFDTNGHYYWRNVRPLHVAPDGLVTLFPEKPVPDVPKAFQDAFKDGELEL